MNTKKMLNLLRNEEVISLPPLKEDVYVPQEDFDMDEFFKPALLNHVIILSCTFIVVIKY